MSKYRIGDAAKLKNIDLESLLEKLNDFEENN